MKKFEYHEQVEYAQSYSKFRTEFIILIDEILDLSKIRGRENGDGVPGHRCKRNHQ